MVTQQDILVQLDRIKKRNRGFTTPPDYKQFLPAAIPGVPQKPDMSLIEARMNMASNYSDTATQIAAVKAQNEREYQEMLAAQQAFQQAQQNLKGAQNLQALTARYQGGGFGPVTSVKGRFVSSGGGTVTPSGRWKDPTPFKLGSGLATTRWRGHSLTLNRSMMDNFVGFLNALAKTGYDIHSIGTYANRNIAGTNTRSLHSYGLAMDINPSANPVAYGKVITNLPRGVGRLAAKYGLVWGGNWNGSKKDPMHFSKPMFGTK